jgi:hypothetical protein
MGPAERVAALMIIIGLVGSIAVVGALMTARGYGLVVAICVIAIVAAMGYSTFAARRHWQDQD